jgi:ribosomal-protein-alanine N-acetyltransferase
MTGLTGEIPPIPAPEFTKKLSPIVLIFGDNPSWQVCGPKRWPSEGANLERGRRVAMKQVASRGKDTTRRKGTAMHLRTQIESCCLRPWREQDKLDLVLHANNRKIWRNLTDLFPHPYTEFDANVWLELANRDTPVTHFAIEFAQQAVGGIGIITSAGIHRYTGKLGYWLGESMWGQGIATAAARVIVDFARNDLKLARLEAEVYEWNPASMRVLEKVGFQREAILRKSTFKDGKLIDSHLFALLF